jgi:hypothetical protein
VAALLTAAQLRHCARGTLLLAAVPDGTAGAPVGKAKKTVYQTRQWSFKIRHYKCNKTDRLLGKIKETPFQLQSAICLI